MKARYIAIIAAAAAMLSFSGCGSVDEDKKTDSVPQFETTTSAPAESEAAAPAAPADDAAGTPATDKPITNITEVPTLEDVDSKADSSDASSGDPQDSAPDFSAAGDHIFSTVNGDFTFNELVGNGLGNVVNGKYYCIVPTDGGAGHAYYQSYYSTDGKVWNEGGVYDETNGTNYHYALSDGRILLFNTMGPVASNVPLVSVLTLGDDNAVKSTPIPDFFKDQYLTDGSVLADTEGLSFFITYNGGYNFTFSFTNDYGNIVYNVNTDLDTNTLMMAD
jgi:hypothetical protein